MGAEFGSAENTFSKSPMKASAECSGSAEAIHPKKGMWKSRTSLEKHLFAIIVLLCLVAAILLSAIILLVVLDVDKSMATENGTSIHNGAQNFDGSGDSSKDSSLGRPTKNPRFTQITPSSGTLQPKPQNSNVCLTRECKVHADYMIRAMNTSVNPCENFYEFACGQYNSRILLQNGVSTVSIFYFSEGILRHSLLRLLGQKNVSKSESVNVARAIYHICMNETQNEELKGLPLLETLTELGEWPLLQEKFDKTKFNFTNLLINSRRNFGSDAFFRIFVFTDSFNSLKKTLSFDQGNVIFGSPPMYLNATQFPTQMDAYRKYFRDIAQLLKTDGNLTRSEAEINVDIDKIIAFETERVKIMETDSERRNGTTIYNRRKIRDLYSLFPQINWVPFMQSIAPAEIAHLFHNDTEIVINAIKYIRRLSDLIEKTDVRILADYVLWGVVYDQAIYLDKRFNNITQNFVKTATGQYIYFSREDACYKIPLEALPLAVGAMYVQAEFKQSDKEEVSRMTVNLMNAFVDMIRTNEWMDEATKVAAIEKANAMIKFVGYPNITIDVPQLDKYYSGLFINESDTYYSVMMKIGVWKESRNFLNWAKPFDKRHIDISPATVNAFYDQAKNAMILPAAFLQPPLFSRLLPKAVNYGAVGSFIGHEITHGFDNLGSQYDKDGNVRNWWSNSSLKEFNARTDCIAKQYGNYTVPKTNYRVKGLRTLGENIADNGGVKEAFKAYQKYVQENGEEPKLPGLQQYTNEQIFFLSYAQVWCGKQTDAAILQQIQTDTHSPSVFRVRGVLSNMEAFANAFNCPPNSPLNPNHKCSVW